MVLTGNVSLTELETSWSFDDLQRGIAALSIKETIQMEMFKNAMPKNTPKGGNLPKGKL